ncbi:hypothetical protein KPL71_027940 [Citrus sinensis]|uniref:Uncharacterized protein n=1 Tax=Citrus sinensis TaxID=2711 RepID=A0ACB8IB91_CITSI|nr:hypothetical protein KPL71_027940 [Citrus sinensis]
MTSLAAIKVYVVKFLIFLPVQHLSHQNPITWNRNCEGRCKKNKIITKRNSIRRDNEFSVWNFDGRFVFGDIIEATEDFDIKYCFGTGGYGSVYIAQLTSSKVIALKKLHHWENEEPASTRSFQNEVDILYPKGSLFRVLHNDNEAIELDWAKRLKVIKELEAFVADFGMTMHLYCDSSNLTLLAGTYGYGAPDKLFRTPMQKPFHEISISELRNQEMYFIEK